MSRYRVARGTQVAVNGRTYGAGEIVEADERRAKEWLRRGWATVEEADTGQDALSAPETAPPPRSGRVRPGRVGGVRGLSRPRRGRRRDPRGDHRRAGRRRRSRPPLTLGDARCPAELWRRAQPPDVPPSPRTAPAPRTNRDGRPGTRKAGPANGRGSAASTSPTTPAAPPATDQPSTSTTSTAPAATDPVGSTRATASRYASHATAMSLPGTTEGSATPAHPADPGGTRGREMMNRSAGDVPDCPLTSFAN